MIGLGIAALKVYLAVEPHPEHLGLPFVLGTTVAMMRIESPVPLNLTES